jgi:hypothetical protein
VRRQHRRVDRRVDVDDLLQIFLDILGRCRYRWARPDFLGSGPALAL